MRSVMKNMFKLLMSAALVGIMLLPVGASAAQYHRYGVNARERHQQRRIRQGIRSGELTRREAGRLESREARIRTREAYARRSGGTFTPRERARIQRQLNRENRGIYHQKHDRQENERREQH